MSSLTVPQLLKQIESAIGAQEYALERAEATNSSQRAELARLQKELEALRVQLEQKDSLTARAVEKEKQITLSVRADLIEAHRNIDALQERLYQKDEELKRERDSASDGARSLHSTADQWKKLADSAREEWTHKLDVANKTIEQLKHSEENLRARLIVAQDAVAKYQMELEDEQATRPALVARAEQLEAELTNVKQALVKSESMFKQSLDHGAEWQRRAQSAEAQLKDREKRDISTEAMLVVHAKDQWGRPTTVRCIYEDWGSIASDTETRRAYIMEAP